MATRKTEAPEELIIRNLRGVPLHLRLGSRKDAYYVELARRGEWGDFATVPGSFRTHPVFRRNLNLSFEIITEAEAERLMEDADLDNFYEDQTENRVVRVSQSAKTVATFDEELDGTGRGRAPQRSAKPRRRKAAEPKAEVLEADVPAGPGKPKRVLRSRKMEGVPRDEGERGEYVGEPMPTFNRDIDRAVVD